MEKPYRNFVNGNDYSTVSTFLCKKSVCKDRCFFLNILMPYLRYFWIFLDKWPNFLQLLEPFFVQTKFSIQTFCTCHKIIFKNQRLSIFLEWFFKNDFQKIFSALMKKTWKHQVVHLKKVELLTSHQYIFMEIISVFFSTQFFYAKKKKQHNVVISLLHLFIWNWFVSASRFRLEFALKI